jgi:hypothetical protein
MARPLRAVRESATTIRYIGWWILPKRFNLIFTATNLFFSAWEVFNLGRPILAETNPRHPKYPYPIEHICSIYWVNGPRFREFKT